MILSYIDILRDGATVHLARALLTGQRPKVLHGHDFFELMWVQNGAVRHHLPDHVETLQEGDLIFLAPGHVHALQGKGEQSLVVSVTLHPDLIAALRARHPQDVDAHFGDHPAPIRATRDMQQMARLNQSALQLERSRGDVLAAEAFLLPLLADLAPLPDMPGPDAPVWLTAACRAAREPAVFQAGAAGLVAQTGKAHAHVSRMFRRYLGQSPSDYINAQRMAFAARALVSDSDSVAQIAADCGTPNMSHFHKLFRAAYGTTPLQYRQQYQRNVVQPG